MKPKTLSAVRVGHTKISELSLDSDTDHKPLVDSALSLAVLTGVTFRGPQQNDFQPTPDDLRRGIAGCAIYPPPCLCHDDTASRWDYTYHPTSR
jgi:hypothetical protein